MLMEGERQSPVRGTDEAVVIDWRFTAEKILATGAGTQPSAGVDDSSTDGGAACVALAAGSERDGCVAAVRAVIRGTKTLPSWTALKADTLSGHFSEEVITSAKEECQGLLKEAATKRTRPGPLQTLVSREVKNNPLPSPQRCRCRRLLVVWHHHTCIRITYVLRQC
jgi:hypothetical protein